MYNYKYIRGKSDKGPIIQTAKAVRVSRQIVSKLINRGAKTLQNREINGNSFRKIDQLTCNFFAKWLQFL